MSMSETQAETAPAALSAEALVVAAAAKNTADNLVKPEDKKPEVKEVTMKGVEFKLLEDAAIVTTPNGVTKTISLQDFYVMISHAFGKAVEDNGAEILLPRNCIYLKTTSKSMYVTLFYPEGVYKLHYKYSSVDRHYSVCTPNIVICLILDISTNSKGDMEARVTTSKYFCTDHTVGSFKIKHSTNVDHPNGLYLLPFSNIYDNGNLCTGDNSMPNIMPRNDLRRLNWQFDVLWNSPFNNDLGLNAVTGWDRSVQDWYAHLAQRNSENLKFPYEKLRGYRPATV